MRKPMHCPTISFFPSVSRPLTVAVRLKRSFLLSLSLMGDSPYFSLNERGLESEGAKERESKSEREEVMVA